MSARHVSRRCCQTFRAYLGHLGKLYQHVCKLAFKQKVLSIKYFQHSWLIAHAFLTFVNGLRANAQIGVNYTDVLTSKRTNKRTWRMTWPRKNSIRCDFDNPSMPKCLPNVMSRHFWLDVHKKCAARRVKQLWALELRCFPLIGKRLIPK